MGVDDERQEEQDEGQDERHLEHELDERHPASSRVTKWARCVSTSGGMRAGYPR